MGNQLVGVAPSQIFPVEYYLTDHGDLQFDISMGSTRFFKVARAKYVEGLIVVKVFAIHDPSLPLQTYRERLENIREKLSTTVNCLPFQRIELTERAGLIMRQYVKHSLYDRISTRPFLTIIEKKWISFQILYALHQCHKLQICHGDIKLENILVTSWNWVLLADFASFKPTYLPDDNPADYSYFFDTSRRRTCYIAPERFVKTLSMESAQKDGFLLNEIPCSSGDLLPSMDIFSAGCALLELWNEGTCPFELSQLLAYRAGDHEPRKHLDAIRDPALRRLLASMIQLDPKSRLSAELYLDSERGRFFPEYFYTFLQSYMLIFSTSPILPADEKIARLHQDIANVIGIFREEQRKNRRRNRPTVATSADDEENEDDSFDREKTPVVGETNRPEEVRGGCDPGLNKDETVDDDENYDDKSSFYGSGEDGLLIITSLVTSCIRGLHHCTAKIRCLDILLQLAANTGSETILDRILPYILHLTQDPAARVRVCALETLTRCLSLVTDLPRSDFNVFPEYVLPAIAPLATDRAVVVRIAYAKNIASLAETALRFLDTATRTSTTTQSNNTTNAQPNNTNNTPNNTTTNTQPNTATTNTQPNNATTNTQPNTATTNTPNNTTTTSMCPGNNYETELAALHDVVQRTLACLLTDPQSLVKQTVMESGLGKLCVFFGKQKANDVLLSHMITFLNDKCDRALRGAFYASVVEVAAYVGWHCSVILAPLLHQGLTDTSEFVIAKSIHATASLMSLGLLQKSALTEYIAECACYLNHPNLWIRHEVCGLIATCARLLSPIDVQCKILPAISAHLRSNNNSTGGAAQSQPPILQIDRPEMLLDGLQTPVPRVIFDSVVKYPDVNHLIETLRERRVIRAKVKQGNVPLYGEMNQTLKALFNRLQSEGLTDHIENQLLSMSAHLIKLNKYRAHSVNSNNTASNQNRQNPPGHAAPAAAASVGHSQQASANNATAHHSQQMSSHNQSIAACSNNYYDSDVIGGGARKFETGTQIANRNSTSPDRVNVGRFNDQAQRLVVNQYNGRLDIGGAKNGLSHVLKLDSGSCSGTGKSNTGDCVDGLSGRKHHRKPLSEDSHHHQSNTSAIHASNQQHGGTVVMNSEWQHMFGGATANHSQQPAGNQQQQQQQPPNATTTTNSAVTTTNTENRATGANNPAVASGAQTANGDSGAAQSATEGTVNISMLKSTRTTTVNDGKSSISQSTATPSPMHNSGGGNMTSTLQNNNYYNSGHTTMNDIASLSEPEGSYIQCRLADCSVELRSLIARQQARYDKAKHALQLADTARWRPPLPPPGWRPRCHRGHSRHNHHSHSNQGGQAYNHYNQGYHNSSLVAHLHEHSAAVSALSAVSPHDNGAVFASSSLDGTVRLWDAGRMETGHNVCNRSKQMYSPRIGPLSWVVSCESGRGLVFAARSSGELRHVRIDANYAAYTSPATGVSLTTHHTAASAASSNGVANGGCDFLDESPAVAACVTQNGAGSVLIYATLYGGLVGWDLRAPGPAWRLQSDLRHGFATSLCLDARQDSWLTLGTSHGRHTCWDLRFRLPIAHIDHPTKSRIRRLACHPTQPSWVLSSVQGNNEVSLWNLETGFRQAVLWASSAPPLSNTQVSTHSVCAMYAGTVDRTGFLLAGGTDQRVRYWNLSDDDIRPEECELLIPAPNDAILSGAVGGGLGPGCGAGGMGGGGVVYKSRLIDGTSVIQEVPLVSTQTAAANIISSSNQQQSHSPGLAPSVASAASGIQTASSHHGRAPPPQPQPSQQLTQQQQNNSYNNYQSGSNNSSNEECPRSGPDSPSSGHRDCITDIILVRGGATSFTGGSNTGGGSGGNQGNQCGGSSGGTAGGATGGSAGGGNATVGSNCCIVTASRDGVIKIWK